MSQEIPKRPDRIEQAPKKQAEVPPGKRPEPAPDSPRIPGQLDTPQGQRPDVPAEMPGAEPLTDQPPVEGP